uniref:Uncharacterized protein n=2 Tax=viral metagenome TaxID=1070528 RepID=A0A6M3XDF6_9ZZZZ
MNYLFDKNWFQKRQRILLWLLNVPIIKIWFRWILRIRKCDCLLNIKINRIEPNAFYYGAKKKGKKIEVVADFRTHNKYSKRLFHAFYPLWYLFHCWDWVIGDRILYPRLSFGFATLTQYPGSIGLNNPVDGFVELFPAAGTTWAATRDATIGNLVSNGGFIGVYHQLWQPRWGFRRGFDLFDTSALGSSAVISAWTVSLYGIAKTDNVNDAYSYIAAVTSTPASTTALITEDFDQLGGTSIASTVDITGFSITGYNDFVGNNLTVINKTGITKLGFREGHDLMNISFTNDPGYSDINYYAAAATGTTQDPKLVVTYSLSALSGGAFLLNMI